MSVQVKTCITVGCIKVGAAVFHSVGIEVGLSELVRYI